MDKDYSIIPRCKVCKQPIPEGFDVLQEGYCPACRWKVTPEQYTPAGVMKRMKKRLKIIK